MRPPSHVFARVTSQFESTVLTFTQQITFTVINRKGIGIFIQTRTQKSDTEKE